MRAAQENESIRQLPPGETRLFVSRKLVRIVFAEDHDTIWRWGARDNSKYHWYVRVPGTVGPLEIRAVASKYDFLQPPTFSSLDSLMTVAQARVCRETNPRSCAPQGEIHAAGNRVIISISDTNMIRQLFALRPPFVHTGTHKDTTALSVGNSRLAAVHYVDPQIPRPDSATRAKRANEILAFGRRNEQVFEPGLSVRREIQSRGPMQVINSFWLQLGDTLPLFLYELRCLSDYCSSASVAGRWSSADTSILALSPPTARSFRAGGVIPLDFGVGAVARAVQPGTTAIVAAAVDTTPRPGQLRPSPPSVTSVAHVIPRIGSLRITAPADTLYAWESSRLSVQLRDTEGRLIPDVPISVQWRGTGANGNQNHYTMDSVIAPIGGTSRTQTIVAAFLDWRDTVTVAIRNSLSPKDLQDEFADSSVAAMLRFDRETALGHDLFLRVLRQVDHAEPARRLNSLVDSLVARVISSRPGAAMRGMGVGEGGASEYRARVAFSTLAQSGNTYGAGRPYARASDVMIHIHRVSNSDHIRQSALSSLAYAGDTRRGIPYLRDVAAQPEGASARQAILSLISAARSSVAAAEAALRQLYSRRRA